MIRALLLSIALVAAPAQAQLCDSRSTPIGADGRALGHLPYGDVAEDELGTLRSDLAVYGCRLRREVIPDLERLLDAAARDPAVAGRILALSCHRSIARQAATFCRERVDASDRAISVAPPGHSEHATGYAFDIAIRPANGCRDAEGCMAATPGYRWFAENAPLYGFELSFPAGNRQNVKWEPWHWRWVGATAATPGAARARFVFAQARREFPGDPQIVVPPRVVPTVVVVPEVVAPPVVEKKKKRRRR